MHLLTRFFSTVLSTQNKAFQSNPIQYGDCKKDGNGEYPRSERNQV